MFTLAVGVILIILAISLIGLYFNDYYSQRMQQQAIQAYWNARSGVESYCDSRNLPASGIYEFGPVGNCQVSLKEKDLVFVGQSGSVKRTLCLLNADPAQRLEKL